jgi:hypothetical protein
VLQCVGNGSCTLIANVVKFQAECGGVWCVRREKREKEREREREREEKRKGRKALLHSP